MLPSRNWGQFISTKQEYLQRKEKQLQEFNRLERRDLCLFCMRSSKSCQCESISPFQTNSRFVVLMHPREYKKEKVGTGRLTHLHLPNSEIIVGVDFDKVERVQELLGDNRFQCFLLYPGENSICVPKQQLPLFEKKTPLFFIIDGTWPMAKVMMRESTSLHLLPRVSFKTNEISKFKLKQQPVSFCLSTIESVYFLLDGLVGLGIEASDLNHDRLLSSLDEMVQYHLECARDPSRKRYRSGEYKDPAERKIAKKWTSRNVCFGE